MKKKLFVIVVCMGAFSLSCNQQEKKEPDQSAVIAKPKEDSLITLAHSYFKELPAVAEDSDNVVTPTKVNLGKVLFYDTRLSKTGNNSCNSCHNLSAFGVDNKATSTGDAGKQGNRNSPTVFNAALHNMQFWDGRAKDVEEQAGMPVMDPVEMGIPHKGFLVDRLKKIKLYQDMFKTAFPGEADPVTYENMQKAIAAFERTLLTPSRFDKFMQGNVDAITAEEKEGLGVFIASECGTCHNGVGIGGGMMQKFGLVTDYRTLTNSKVDDEGRKKLTKGKNDKDVFKVAGLRNVAGTYPYFHDGSVASLDSAIKIMAKVQLNKNLGKDETRAIVSFLNSLTGDISPEAKTFPPELEKH